MNGWVDGWVVGCKSEMMVVEQIFEKHQNKFKSKIANNQKRLKHPNVPHVLQNPLKCPNSL